MAAASAAPEMEERVHVAVCKEVKKSKSVLLWALRTISNDQAIVVLVHVHRPVRFIPIMGGRFRASQLKEEQIKEYRQLEREKMEKVLDEYLLICQHVKVQAEKLVIEMDDVANGLLKLISQHRITKLVMGAAADKHYSKKMEAPRSKTAMIVKQQAHPSCKIWFVCRGILICTREAGFNECLMLGSLTARPRSISSLSEELRSRCLPQIQGESLNYHASPVHESFWQKSRSDYCDSHGGGIMVALSGYKDTARASISGSRLNAEKSFDDPREETSSSQSSDPSSWSASDEVLSNSGSLPMPKDEENVELLMLSSVDGSDDDLQFLSARHELEDLGVDVEVYDKLQQAVTEAENSKREAYEESCRRQKAERDAIQVARRARASDLSYIKELRKRKEVEETLSRLTLELETLRNQQDAILKEHEKANEEKLALELRISDSDHTIKDLEEKLSAAQYILSSLQAEHEELQHERDDAVREAEDLRQKNEQEVASTCGPMISGFSYSELQQGTDDFHISRKIGEGGYGSVYKGFLRHTVVAVKTLNPQSMQGLSEFSQEVEILSRVRHPNLVNLLGACPEAWALIYEFLPSGNLEDRLDCKDNTQPLTWQTRTQIAAEICSALIFLHSNKPHPVVHGDLKPENILLDANFVCKLSNFGICRLLTQSDTTTTTLYRHTHPKGTYIYMDPDYLATGELTQCSDVYSFGVIILRLLTGKPGLGIIKEVQKAVEKGHFHEMIDPLAGDWPFVQAKQLAHLGLRCCDISRRNRPDLAEDAWRLLEPLMKAASLPVSPLSFGSVSEDCRNIPSYFICPIFQEIMRNPHIATDGFTYEAEAIRGWFDSGHDTSPMTNLKLPNCDLIPNHALRSAIQEWLEQQSSSNHSITS